MVKTKNIDLLEVENIDRYIECDNSDNNCPIHPLLIPHKSRLIVVGASSSGKTNWLINALVKPQLKYEKLYIYSKNLDQPKYKFLKKEIENTENLIGDGYKILEAFENTLDNLIELEDLDPKYQNLLIIDDFPILNKKEKEKVAKLYTQIRHKNGSVIYLQQLYFQLDRAIRNNLSHIVLFNNKNKKEVELLAREIGSDLDKGQFRKLYNRILNKKYKWMLVDLFNDNPVLKYRDGYLPLNLSNM